MTSGVMWHDMDLVKQVLQWLYLAKIAINVIGCGLGIDMCCGN